MAKRPAKLIAAYPARIRDLRAQVRDLNAALTDCMQHKVDLESGLEELHQRHDRAHETIENMKEHIGLLDRQAQDAERHIERQAGEISTLKRTVRTVAAFAAREPGVDVRWSPDLYADVARTVSQATADVDGRVRGVNRLLDTAREIPGVKSAWRDAPYGVGATETL